VQLFTQVTGSGRVNALCMLVAAVCRGVDRRQRGAQFGFRVVGTVGGEKIFGVIDVAAPAAKLGCFVVTEGIQSGVLANCCKRSLSICGAADSGAQTQSAR